MMLSAFVSKMLASTLRRTGKTRRSVRKPYRSLPPSLEALEDRNLLSAFIPLASVGETVGSPSPLPGGTSSGLLSTGTSLQILGPPFSTPFGSLAPAIMDVDYQIDVSGSDGLTGYSFNVSLVLAGLELQNVDSAAGAQQQISGLAEGGQQPLQSVNDVGPGVNAGGPYSGTASTPITFTASASDPSPVDSAGGFSYSWTFGDGTTANGANVSHSYANAGSYTATVTVTEQDGDTASANTNVIVTASGSGGTLPPPDTAPYITTPWDNIPNFGAQPTLYTVKSGNWSDPSIWSLDRLPTTGDIVDINPGTTVTYDVNSTAALNTVEIQNDATLNFRTDLNTTLTVVNLLVLQGGTLQIGTAANPVAANVTAQIVFANQPLNTALDPSQYGNGLIALGTVNIHGAVRTPYATLAQEAHAGDTTLHLATAVTGWQPGNTLFLPDTRQLDWNQRNTSAGAYTPQWENVTVQSVSADGLTVTLATPLQYDHLGGYDATGKLVYLPQVAALTHNVVLHSQSASGTRGQTMFTDRANVDIEYATFGGLGRTQGVDANGNPIQADNSTYDSNGNVTHVGTNEFDRFPVNFHDLMGPTTPQADGYQYTFLGNTVTCPLEPMPFLWGIAIDNSHYGLIQDNVVDNWAGAGIALEQGNESYNKIDGNFVARVTGTGVRENVGLQGDGFWLPGPNNYVTNNIATDINVGGTYSYGYDLNLAGQFGLGGNAAIPAFQGADTSVTAQTTTINLNAMPLLAFAGNSAYGAMPNGMTFWWLDTNDSAPLNGPGSTIKNFTVWNNYQWGIFAYQSHNLTIDGFTDLGNAAIMNEGNGSTGMVFFDYYENNLTVSNADLENLAVGVVTPVNAGGTETNTGGTVLTLSNSTLANQTDVEVGTPWSVLYYANWMEPSTVVLQNDKFDVTDVSGATAIDMAYAGSALSNGQTWNAIVPQTVLVYDYNGVSGDNFQVYYTQQASNFVVPPSIKNSDGTARMLGAPVSGLTNAQAWAQYGIAIAGAVAPSTAKTQAGINGLVNPI